jgi:hypothetical protein
MVDRRVNVRREEEHEHGCGGPAGEIPGFSKEKAESSTTA